MQDLTPTLMWNARRSAPVILLEASWISSRWLASRRTWLPSSVPSFIP